MTEPNTAEDIATLKNNLIDFASQGGDQRTQGTAERLINELLQKHTAQTLDRLKERINERKQSIEASYDKGGGKKVFSAPQLESRVNELRYVLTIIEEVSDE